MGVTPKQLANLKPPKKGEVRNPNGRPKKLPALDELLANVLSAEKAGKTEAEAILIAIILKARKGNVKAAELILNRAYGKPKESIELSNKEGEVFKIGYGPDKVAV